jgi:glycosyltransferase involved in cell wall biosynthesis
MENAPLVSIVTPFYNTQAYLAECIESVLRQSYQNWEYILVDNFSTDGSGEIAARYAAEFPAKIRVVRPPSFLPQVQNYNFALSSISSGSKYCKMVQADDWIFPECIREMVDVAESHPSVGIVSAYELEGRHVSLDGLPYPSAEVSGRDACRLFFLRRLYLFGSPNSLLYRSDLVRSRKPFYDERLAPFEDGQVCFDLLKSSNLGFVHQVLTFSRRDNESISNRIRPYNYLALFRLQAVVLYAREFLTPFEYKLCLQDAERQYFLFLGKSALKRKPAAFWEFHRKGLAVIGYKLDSSLYAKWAPLALLDFLGNPKRAIDSFLDRRSKTKDIVFSAPEDERPR